MMKSRIFHALSAVPHLQYSISKFYSVFFDYSQKLSKNFFEEDGWRLPHKYNTNSNSNTKRFVFFFCLKLYRGGSASILDI